MNKKFFVLMPNLHAIFVPVTILDERTSYKIYS